MHVCAWRGVRLSAELRRSGGPCAPRLRVAWMSRPVLLMFLWITWGIAMGCCLLWGRVDLLPQRAMKEPGIHVPVPVDKGNLFAVPNMGSCHPWFLWESDLAPAAHPCSGFSLLPLAKLGVPGRLCREVPAVPKSRWADPAPCGGSCSICWDLSGEALG